MNNYKVKIEHQLLLCWSSSRRRSSSSICVSKNTHLLLLWHLDNNNNNSPPPPNNNCSRVKCSSAAAFSFSKRLSSSSSSVIINNTNNNTTAAIGMEEEEEREDNYYYSQYDHNDACKDSRWTSRESYEYMLKRPWHQVVDFYSNLILLLSPPMHYLSSIFLPTPTPTPTPSPTPAHQQHNNLIMPEMMMMHSVCEDGGTKQALVSDSMTVSKKERKGGRWERVTFKILLSYHGSSFDGWQKQPALNTVQRSVEKTLGRFVDEMKAKQLTDRGLPVEGTAVVAGRTDKGVTALHQVCSFYTWRKDVKPQHIIDAFSEGEQGKLRIVSVSEVSRVFHPNFCAKWRRYLYIFPFNDGEVCMEQKNVSGEDVEGSIGYDESMLEVRKKPIKFEICKVNELLSQLEGKLLSYKIFARDTKASRSTGPPTECFMFHARAAEAKLPSSVQDGKSTKAMCVELVANRFLRKMVRVLVATAIREAAAGAEEDALIKLMEATCRRATAPPAPPEGLCLVDVGYDEFDPRICYV